MTQATPEQIIARYEELRAQIPSCLDSPSKLSDLRVRLAYYLSEIGLLIVEAREMQLNAKNAASEEYLKARKEGKSIEDCKVQAKYNTSKEVIESEVLVKKYKRYYEGGKELLNAIASKLSALNLEYNNS